MVAGGVERLVVGRDADEGRGAGVVGRRRCGRAGCRGSRRRMARAMVHARHVVTPTGLPPAGDPERGDLDLQQLVAVHAGDVDPAPGVVRLGAVRHVARREIGDVRHRAGLHHGDHVGARMVAVKIRIGDEGELPVRRESDRGGEHLELGPPDQGVGLGIELPQRAVRRAVRDRDVVGAVVGCDGEVMRAVDVGRHDPDRNRLLDSQCPVARLEPGDDVARFADDTDAITGIGSGRPARWEAPGPRGTEYASLPYPCMWWRSRWKHSRGNGGLEPSRSERAAATRRGREGRRRGRLAEVPQSLRLSGRREVWPRKEPWRRTGDHASRSCSSDPGATASCSRKKSSSSR